MNTDTATTHETVIERKRLVFKWGTSTGRRTPGYLRCSLYADGKKVARCYGGGYDMKGSALADYIEVAFADRLLRLINRPFYGLTFHDPDYDPGKAPLNGKTVAEAEAAGESLGLARYQAVYAASQPTPSATHRIPMIDGACGVESVSRIMTAIGLRLETLSDNSKREECCLTVLAEPAI